MARRRSIISDRDGHECGKQQLREGREGGSVIGKHRIRRDVKARQSSLTDVLSTNFDGSWSYVASKMTQPGLGW